MPRHDSARFKLSHGWLRGEDFWGDPTSENTRKIDTLMHPYALSMTLTEPPALITIGDQYIVAPGGTGLWAARDNHLATLTENGWLFFAPFTGLRVRVKSPGGFYYYEADEDPELPGQWIAEPATAPDDPTIGTRYDIAMSVGYEPEPGETILVFPMPQPMTLPAGAEGSKARNTTPPTVQVNAIIRRNGTAIGTIMFPVGDFYGTVSVSADAIFAEDDLLTVVMPATLPDGFANFGAVLRLYLLTGG